MKRLIFALLLSGCVSEDTAVGYAERAYPECSGHRALAHHYSPDSVSQTEVQMTCEGVPKSITVKCVFGFGIISDTTCHRNN